MKKSPPHRNVWLRAWNVWTSVGIMSNRCCGPVVWKISISTQQYRRFVVCWTVKYCRCSESIGSWIRCDTFLYWSFKRIAQSHCWHCHYIWSVESVDVRKSSFADSLCDTLQLIRDVHGNAFLADDREYFLDRLILKLSNHSLKLCIIVLSSLKATFEQ